MANLTTILFAVGGGFLPAFIWLWFWLKEDKKHPEPKRMLLLTFLFGMLVLFVALVLEYLVLTNTGEIFQSIFGGMLFILSLALIEEVVKYVAAGYALHSKRFDEPIDAVIYLITASLGFAALENFFFLLKIFNESGLYVGLITGDLRFLGATLLHSTSSAIVGIAIAYAYYHKKERKVIHTIVGISLATLLHGLFNFYIIKTGDEKLLMIFAGLWVAVIVILVFMEKIKRIK